MKVCSQCEREIPDSATTCDQCDSLGALDLGDERLEVVDLGDEFAQDDTAPPSPIQGIAPAPTPALAPAAGRVDRRLMLAGLLVVVGGTLTFAMLRSSAPATPIASAPAAARPTATKPAAAKPSTTPSAPQAAAAPAVVASPASAVSKWHAANAEWLLNARRGAAFELKAENRVAIWRGSVEPMLVVRCDAGKMQAFVFTASAIQMEAQDENHTVHVSFDGEPESSERWADSDDHDALFAPDGAAFARRVSTARTLRVSYTPHNSSKATAEFQVAGLGDTIQPAARHCGWKK
jgi:hypothetical protein